MPAPTAGPPAYALIVSGLLTVIYSLLYGLWTLSVLVLPVMGTIGSIGDGTPIVDALIALLLMVMVPLVQLVGFCVTAFLGVLTMFGGWRLNGYRSVGVAWIAVLCSTAAPAIGIVTNAASALNLGACGMGCITGCLLGNIPTLLLLVIGLGASIAAGMHISKHRARFQ